MGGAGLHRSHGVGHGHIGIVVRVDAQHAVEAPPHLGHDLDQPGRDGSAVGVAQAEHVGARRVGGLQRAQGEGGIGVVAVEEVLGVVDHFAPVVLEELHRF